MVLVLGTTGYATVPMSGMREYVAEAGTSPKGDGTVRHYHVLVTTGVRPELFHHGKPTRIAIDTYYTSLSGAESELDTVANDVLSKL
jgi:hypothetical protein